MIKRVIEYLIKYLKEKNVDSQNVEYLTVIKKENYYIVNVGPKNMDYHAMACLVYYAVKYLSDKIDLTIEEVMYSLIPIFKHIETGQDLNTATSEMVDYISNISDKVKIDA